MLFRDAALSCSNGRIIIDFFVAKCHRFSEILQIYLRVILFELNLFWSVHKALICQRLLIIRIANEYLRNYCHTLKMRMSYY